VLHDIRLALRSLRRAPAFTTTTILTLALAAGANAAIFAVVYGVLLKPLPFPDAGSLVAVWPGRFQSTVDLIYTREHGRMFAGVAAVAPGWTMSLTGSGEPAKLTVARVSGNLFDTLGTQPILGRTFSEDAARPGAEAVMILDHAFWTRHFGGDPNVVGRIVTVDGEAVRVTAIMPPAFQVFGLKADAYTPFVIDESAWYHRISTSFFLARLAPGVTIEQAAGEYRVLTQLLKSERAYSDQYGRDATVVGMHEAVVGDIRGSMVVLAGAVGLILLIAGANVGTLQLTRAASRSRDLAVRSALGASRARIVRQLLVENAIIAALGGALGVALASLLLPALVALLPADTPRIAEIALDPIVSGGVLAAATIVGISVGLLPAAGVTRLRTSPLIRLSNSTETPAARRARGSLVSAEVAFAVVLAVGAGLMLQTLWTLRHVDPGFDPDGVLTLHLQPSGAKYRDVSIADYYDSVLLRVRALPGVRAAGAIQHLPFSGYSWSIPFEPEGFVTPTGAAMPVAGARIVTPGYFGAIGQPLLAGRDIERADSERSDVAIVNEAIATKYFGSVGKAIGRILRLRSARGTMNPLRIVGVVADVHHSALTSAPGPEVYTSISPTSINAMMLAVRIDGAPLSVVPAVREAIWSVDRDVPLSDIETMGAKIGESLGRPRLLLVLLGAFAALGGLLALLGVYGVVAYSVAQRWRELGIMIALGAERRRIVGSVLREAAVYAAAGLAIGIPGAVVGSRLLQTLVFGVSPTDLPTYGSIAAVTMVTVVAAAVLPAIRASMVDPVSALKA
jgi:predicted permease